MPRCNGRPLTGMFADSVSTGPLAPPETLAGAAAGASLPDPNGRQRLSTADTLVLPERVISAESTNPSGQPGSWRTPDLPQLSERSNHVAPR